MGPKRGAIALGILAAGVGGFFLARYLLAKRAAAAVAEPETPAPRVKPIPSTAPIGPALA